jgi:hypothetical protein
MGDSNNFAYDVALSFAGEDRPYVAQVAAALADADVKVFYDRYESATLWGKDLYAHLSDVYQNQARFSVVFVSKHYAVKVWTSHERRSAQARAIREKTEYILPARFDDTEIPGFLPTIGYVDLRTTSPLKLAELILAKLGRRESSEVESSLTLPDVTSHEELPLAALANEPNAESLANTAAESASKPRPGVRAPLIGSVVLFGSALAIYGWVTSRPPATGTKPTDPPVTNAERARDTSGATLSTPGLSVAPNAPSATGAITGTPSATKDPARNGPHLLSNGTLIWDPASKLVWAADIYQFGLTKDLFAGSRQQVTTPTKNLEAIATQAAALRLGNIGGWRIAHATEIETLRRFDGSVVFRAFAQHRITTGATNVVGIHMSPDGGIATWGYQHANFLQGPDLRFGAYWLNDYGVWLVTGPMDQPISSVEAKEVYGQPERATEMTFDPQLTSILEKSGASIRSIAADHQQASVGNIGEGERRSVFFYSLAELPAGALVRGELVLEPVVTTGTGTVKFSLFKTDGVLRASETGDWEPTSLGSGEFNTVIWDGRARSRPTLPQHLMRNAATQRGWLGIHAIYTGNGGIEFKPPRLIATYIRQADLLISR